jgi:hypothetical protein
LLWTRACCSEACAVLIQGKTTGSSFRNFGDADGHRLFVDLRKAVVSSTPVVLAQDTARARLRITQM